MKSASQILNENAAVTIYRREMAMWLRLLGGFLGLSLVANVLLGHAAFYRFPVKTFLWTSDAQAVCEAIPLTEPNISQARLMDFAASAAVQLNSYDYSNWKMLINSALVQHFTPKGRDNYRASLQETGIIERVVLGFLSVSAVTIGPPNIAEEGKLAGRYYWIVEVPLKIYYRSNRETKSENRLLTMTAIRVDPNPLNPNGIAIDAVQSSQLLSNQVSQ